MAKIIMDTSALLNIAGYMLAIAYDVKQMEEVYAETNADAIKNTAMKLQNMIFSAEPVKGE